MREGRGKLLRHTQPSCPAQGASSTPRLFNSIADVSGILDHPHARVMTTGGVAHSIASDMTPHSRGAMRPGFARSFAPLDNRGRRESRVRAAPAVSCAMCTEKCAHEHTGSAEASRPSLRDGVTVSFALSLATGLSCHHHPRTNALAFAREKRLLLKGLDASVGASGPHDFAVHVTCRSSSAHPRPPHPTARS